MNNESDSREKYIHTGTTVTYDDKVAEIRQKAQQWMEEQNEMGYINPSFTLINPGFDYDSPDQQIDEPKTGSRSLFTWFASIFARFK
jgi:hypothetical protein